MMNFNGEDDVGPGVTALKAETRMWGRLMDEVDIVI